MYSFLSLGSTPSIMATTFCVLTSFLISSVVPEILISVGNAIDCKLAMISFSRSLMFFPEFSSIILATDWLILITGMPTSAVTRSNVPESSLSPNWGPFTNKTPPALWSLASSDLSLSLPDEINKLSSLSGSGSPRRISTHLPSTSSSL